MLEKFSCGFPGVVRIEPSSICNLKCIHCPTGTTKANRGLMAPQTFDVIIKNILKHQKQIRVVVLYHGGEPLLNKNFPNMVKQIKEIGIPLIKTVSNGMLLTDEMIEKTCESGLDAIEFSLDGTSFEQNDFIRRGCNGREVVRNIKKMITYKKENAHLKPGICISTTQFIKETQNIPADTVPAVPNYLLEVFSDEINNKDLSFKTTFAMKWPDMNVDRKQFFVNGSGEESQIQNFCDHVLNTITVRWNGDVVPCCYDLTSRVVLGNIYDDNLETIWNNQKYLRLRMSIYEKNFYPSLCDECNTVKNHKYLCVKEDSKGT